MMSLSSPAANPVPNAYERTSAAQSASGTASARNASSASSASAGSGAADEASGEARERKANDAARVAAIAKMSAVDTAIPDAVTMLATMAVVNAGLGSTPATLALMSDIAVASGSGTLSDADRATLQVQYAQLSRQVAGAVGSSSAGQQAAADHQRDSDAGQNTQSSDDRRSTLTRDEGQAPQTVRHEPTEQLVRTTKLVEVAVDAAPEKTPRVTLHTHELHVGTDSYEPVAVKQTQTRASRPATFAELEQQTTTHRVRVAQVTQIREMSQVAQVQQLSVVA